MSSALAVCWRVTAAMSDSGVLEPKFSRSALFRPGSPESAEQRRPIGISDTREESVRESRKVKRGLLRSTGACHYWSFRG